MKKNILGLDLGTNSIGWALVDAETKKIIKANSRIIPMSQDVMNNYEAGNSDSQTEKRTGYRGVRHLRERELLRRERLHRVLNTIGFLPKHYADGLDEYGKFLKNTEIKLPYEATSKKEFRFLFQNSFDEMVQDFRKLQPELFYKKRNGDETKIPYDWTIYYLRKKALTQKIQKEELAWLLLHFNQKRGYYQLRGEDEETTQTKKEEFYSLKIIDVIPTDSKTNDEIWYNVILENGWIYPRKSTVSLENWIGRTRDFIITTDLDIEGNPKKDKEGNVKRSFRSPKDDDWNLLKKKTENEIDKLQAEDDSLTVGAYIYENLLKDPRIKIRGKFIRTIERKYYKSELLRILMVQQQFHSELRDPVLYNTCIELLYKSNEAHRNNMVQKDFVHLFVNDILFYQRPLKSKKSQIDECKLETRTYIKEGKKITEGLKCIPKSHPLFQEFRLWQWIHNLKIYEREKEINQKIILDYDVTDDYLASESDYENLYDFLNDRKDIDQKSLLKHFKLTSKKYRWNYMDTEDNKKTYPGNSIRNTILNKLDKVNNIDKDFLNNENLFTLWHILYSVDDTKELESALDKFRERHGLDYSFVEVFKKTPKIEKAYGSFSHKAISKLLPLMRCGKYWKEESIDPNTKQRINNIISGEFDEKMKIRVREHAQRYNLESIDNFKMLPQWLSSYIVYDKHSEQYSDKWKSPDDIRNYLKHGFKQHSMRNPIVEQIITETLRVVTDLWEYYGDGKEGFFEKIKIELGRDLKNTQEEKQRLTEHISKNENTNMRIKALLMEFSAHPEIENVRPHSPYQADILKIYEEYVLQNDELFDTKKNEWIKSPMTDEIEKISKLANPTSSQVIKYKLWLEQRYRSPYTGNVIPLNKLFTSAYEIEHIIPQALYLDDSFSNKVICEAEVNKKKDNDLAYNFITNNQNAIVDLAFGKKVNVFTLEQYKAFITEHYKSNKPKLRKLLLEEIPTKMIDRQLNDTRYISSAILKLLSNIVREPEEQESKSKNLISTSGGVTSILRNDWGFNDLWNDLITPRFKRMNELTNSNDYGKVNPNTKTFLPEVPFIYQKSFNKKRIDHRHHALDAIVIALTELNHINYINNVHAKGKANNINERYEVFRGLRESVCEKINSGQSNRWRIKKPYDNVTQDTKVILEDCVVTFKQNTRVINKASNYYTKFVDGKKKLIKQEGQNWAIRKSLHKETVYGKVDLRNMKIVKGKIFTASRKSLDTSFTLKVIGSITDIVIQRILTSYLKSKGNNPEIAFTPEGIEELNKNISQYNKGVPHQPILKVRIFEEGNRFMLGSHGNNIRKFVEAQKGTNLFFAVYEKDGKRNYATIPLNEVIEHQKLEAHLPILQRTVIPIDSSKGRLLFYLSPNDLVYVPTDDEIETKEKINISNLNKNQIERIYKMVSSSGNQCFFIQANVSTSIVNKMEYSTLNKMEKSLQQKMIKEVALKLEVSRIGKILKIFQE